MDFLEQLVDVLFKSYNTEHSALRFAHARSWLYLLAALNKHGSTLLEQLLERAVFSGIALSIRPSVH